MVVGAIHDQSTSQPFRDERRSIHGQIDAEHESLAADFADKIEFAGEFLDTRTQFRATLTNVREELFFLDHAEEFKRSRANERAAAESGSVHSRRERSRKFFI